MKEWKKHLYIISIAQFSGMVAFGLVLPFVAFYLVELGAEESHINFYVGLSSALPALTMAVFSPIWGSMADRYGRKAMLLRAQTGGCFVLICFGFSTSPIMFLVFRAIQGALTGTMAAASAFLSADLPEDKLSSGLGIMMAAHFMGFSFGPAMGGYLAEIFGYKICFMAAAVLMGLTALSLGLFLKENKATYGKELIEARKKKEAESGKKKKFFTVFILLAMASIFFNRLSRSAFMPYISLYVQDMNGMEGASAITGLIVSGECVGISLASLTLTRFKHSEHGFKVLIIMSIIAVPVAFACYASSYFNMILFGILFMIMHYTIGAVEPIINSLASETVDISQRGVLFGWFSTAINVALVLTPLISAWIADMYGYSNILLFSACVIILIMITVLAAYKFRDEKVAKHN